MLGCLCSLCATMVVFVRCSFAKLSFENTTCQADLLCVKFVVLSNYWVYGFSAWRIQPTSFLQP